MGVIPTMRNSADWRALFLVGMYFVLTYVIWFYDEVLPQWALVPLWLSVAWLSFVGATITHNTMHCKVFKEYWANKTFQIALTLTYGHPVSSYVPGHNLSHHRFTQWRRDIMRTSKVQYKWNLLNLIMFQPSVAGAVTMSDMRFIRLQVAMGNRFAEQVLREFAVLIVTQGLALYSDPWRFALYLWVPHLIAQWGIVTMNILQHDGCVTSPVGETLPNSARSFTGGMLNWFTMNNGLHTVHHMHPTMHWSQYERKHKELVEPYCHPELNQPSMVGYMFRQFVWPGKRVTFDGKPVKFPAVEVGPDEEWIEYPENINPEDLKMTPLKTMRFLGDAFVLLGVKLVAPIYSPIMNLAG
mmetsp:Transcript_19847/g.46442  ORF Transcript_19847/g.46442 Transcript_19847/m.46442 type:complete len:355 (+) Transcript_19847:169-1233(+)